MGNHNQTHRIFPIGRGCKKYYAFCSLSFTGSFYPHPFPKRAFLVQLSLTISIVSNAREQGGGHYPYVRHFWQLWLEESRDYVCGLGKYLAVNIDNRSTRVPLDKTFCHVMLCLGANQLGCNSMKLLFRWCNPVGCNPVWLQFRGCHLISVSVVPSHGV